MIHQEKGFCWIYLFTENNSYNDPLYLTIHFADLNESFITVIIRFHTVIKQLALFTTFKNKWYLIYKFERIGTIVSPIQE